MHYTLSYKLKTKRNCKKNLTERTEIHLNGDVYEFADLASG